MVGQTEVMRVHRKFKEGTDRKRKEISENLGLDISSTKITKVLADMMEDKNLDFFPMRKKDKKLG